MPDKTEKKQGKFRKGYSGNLLGRPRGTRNKATVAAEALPFYQKLGYSIEFIREGYEKSLRCLC